MALRGRRKVALLHLPPALDPLPAPERATVLMPQAPAGASPLLDHSFPDPPGFSSPTSYLAQMSPSQGEDHPMWSNSSPQTPYSPCHPLCFPQHFSPFDTLCVVSPISLSVSLWLKLCVTGTGPLLVCSLLNPSLAWLFNKYKIIK